MTIARHELRQGGKALAVWTLAVACLLAVCIFLFPEMKGEMEEAGRMFASMGSFTAAFGMDRLNFGTFIGYYAVECGNILGVGGAFFASLTGVQALAKEERGGTAEFLLTQPVSRRRVVTEKLLAVLAQIAAMNLAIFGVVLLSIKGIGEEFPWRELLLLHLAYFLLQEELACVCFGISAFLKKSGAGIGLGLATVAYFLNLIANLSESAAFLKYVTPFGYCEGADIITDGALDARLVIVGLSLAVAGIAAAYLCYERKEIR